MYYVYVQWQNNEHLNQCLCHLDWIHNFRHTWPSSLNVLHVCVSPSLPRPVGVALSWDKPPDKRWRPHSSLPSRTAATDPGPDAPVSAEWTSASATWFTTMHQSTQKGREKRRQRELRGKESKRKELVKNSVSIQSSQAAWKETLIWFQYCYRIMLQWSMQALHLLGELLAGWAHVSCSRCRG